MFRLAPSRSILRSTVSVAKRTYADSPAGVLKLNFALPHETIYAKANVTQVNLPIKSGRIGVLADHVPIVEQLVPGVVEVLDGTASKKFFVSGGFATMQPDSTLSITSVEAYPLESFSQESVRNLLADAQKELTSSEEKKAAEAAVKVEVLEALQAALK